MKDFHLWCVLSNYAVFSNFVILMSNKIQGVKLKGLLNKEANSTLSLNIQSNVANVLTFVAS
mgnify:CR=1 FL=1